MCQAMRTALQSLLSLCVLAACTTALAQAYPSKPVRWIIPFAPGGGLDILTRAIAPQVSNVLGQPMVAENRPANAGIIAAEAVAKSAPDGYTLLTGGNAILTFNKLIYPKLGYDPERDFAPITQISDAPIALWVHESVPAKTLQEFIAYAKANPGKLNYGAGGVGHPFHLAMELLLHRVGAKMVFVPYKGQAPVIQDVIAGRLQAMFYPSTEQMTSQVRAGKLRVLAAVSGKRLPNLPETPTFEESGIRDFEAAGWIAVVAPAGTPRDIIMRLNREIVKVVASPDLSKLYGQLSMLPTTGTPEQLGQKIRKEIADYTPLIKTLGITLE